MKVQDYFDLGCKLFGVYFLFLSVPLFIAAIISFYPVQNTSADFEKYLTFYLLITRLLPFIYVIIGVYLIKNNTKLFSFAYSSVEKTKFAKSLQPMILALSGSVD